MGTSRRIGLDQNSNRAVIIRFRLNAIMLAMHAKSLPRTASLRIVLKVNPRHSATSEQTGFRLHSSADVISFEPQP